MQGRPRAPWIQGQVERLNQSVKRWISTVSSEKNNFGQYIDSLQQIFVRL